jgi:hypothetical protein
MKLGELVVAQEVLRKLLALELPAAASYKIARAVRPIQAELQGYEEQRTKLVRQFGEAEGQQIIVKPDKMVEFNAEMNALLQVDVDLEIKTLNPDLLGDVGIRAADFMALWFLFSDE